MTCNVHVMHVITCNNIPGVSLMDRHGVTAAGTQAVTTCSHGEY